MCNEISKLHKWLISWYEVGTDPVFLPAFLLSINLFIERYVKDVSNFFIVCGITSLFRLLIDMVFVDIDY